ncbi:MAG: hypothetical protein BGN87_03360 [Rhizobiales bacterium 65-79]|nr:MAG: hypothetical protein BGN87_03360 [Rhizobiales bacterium 65-79]
MGRMPFMPPARLQEPAVPPAPSLGELSARTFAMLHANSSAYRLDSAAFTSWRRWRKPHSFSKA